MFIQWFTATLSYCTCRFYSLFHFTSCTCFVILTRNAGTHINATASYPSSGCYFPTLQIMMWNFGIISSVGSYLIVIGCGLLIDGECCWLSLFLWENPWPYTWYKLELIHGLTEPLKTRFYWWFYWFFQLRLQKMSSRHYCIQFPS